MREFCLGRCHLHAERHDTTYVEVPITQRCYHDDSLYTAWVSGFLPQLDSIRVYPVTKTVTVISKEIQPTPYKWTLSATADVLALPGLLDARAGLTYERQITGPLRVSASAGYHAGSLGRGPYAAGGLKLEFLHNR